MPCKGEQLVQRRAGTGGDDVKCQRLNIFHAGVANFWVQPKFSGHFGQEGAFLRSCFEECDPGPVPQEFCQNQSRESGPASEIGEGFGVVWNKPD